MYIGGLAAFELLKKDGCGRSRDLHSKELDPATGLFIYIHMSMLRQMHTTLCDHVTKNALQILAGYYY